jgi:hypothetical protein
MLLLENPRRSGSNQFDLLNSDTVHPNTPGYTRHIGGKPVEFVPIDSQQEMVQVAARTILNTDLEI